IPSAQLADSGPHRITQPAIAFRSNLCATGSSHALRRIEPKRSSRESKGGRPIRFFFDNLMSKW
ncbi:hypothetical protein, partial [Dyella sp.]|uniref:hypothetical protein n=1 Tax=Dyella sp. TaxID=1869338 RepID=UPI002D78EBB4